MAAAATMDQFIYIASTAHEDWPIWIFRFENFLILIKVDVTKPEGMVLAARYLIHAGGETILKILKAFDDMTTATYEQLKQAMSDYCIPVDAKAALYRFTGTRQGQEENLGDYVLRLKPLAYAGGISKANTDAEVLRVIGQHANSVEVKIKCLEKDISCSKLVTWFSTLEAHQKCMRTEPRSEDINYVDNRQNAPSRKRQHESTNQKKKCNFCGGAYPHERPCPARGATCNFCKNKNHFESECRKKKSSQSAPSTNRQNNRNQSGYRSNGTQSNNQRSNGNRVYNVEGYEEQPQHDSEQKGYNAELFNMFHKWLETIEDSAVKPQDQQS